MMGRAATPRRREASDAACGELPGYSNTNRPEANPEFLRAGRGGEELCSVQELGLDLLRVLSHEGFYEIVRLV